MEARPSPTDGKRPGRPRDDTIEHNVLEATLSELANSGVAGMSMKAVAAAAGVSKVTLYSRWSSKSELIGAALNYLQLGRLPAATGDVRTDLVGMLRAMREQYDLVGGMSIIGSCLADEPTSGALLDIVRERTILPRRVALVAIVQSAIDDGIFRRDVDAEQAVSAVIGMFYGHYLAGIAMSDDWDESAVDLLLRGFMR